MRIQNGVDRILRRLRLPTRGAALREFHSHDYQRYNARRLEHLASLRISVRGLSVLEVGAGIGDLSHYYLDRHCRLTITEARPVNLRCLRQRYPQLVVQALDLDHPTGSIGGPFDVIHCYGVLYHLCDPTGALAFLADRCRQHLFLETCVSYGEEEAIHPIREPRRHPSQAISGIGCRPTRPWLYRQLTERFEHVYLPRTQPNHEQFPLDWTVSPDAAGLVRSIFVCSRTPLANDQLVEELPTRQSHHA